MKYLLSSLMFFLFAGVVYGQQKDQKRELQLLYDTVNSNFFSRNNSVERQAERAIQLAIRTGDSAKLADLYRMAGVIQYFNGNHTRALALYLKSMKIYQSMADLRGEARTYNEMGTLYKKNKRLELALKMFDNGYDAALKAKDTANMATSISNAGIVYEMRNDLTTALKKYFISLELYRAIRDTVGLSYSHENIGGVYLMQKKYEEAEQHLIISLQFRKAKQLMQATAFSLHYLGELYLQKGDFVAAVNMFGNCLEMAERMHYPDLKQRVCFSLSDIYRRQGKYKEALDYFSRATAIKDSLFDAESSLRLSELQTRHEVDMKDRENMLLRKTLDLAAQRTENRNLLIVFISILLLIIVASGLLYFKRRQQLTTIQTSLRIQRAEQEQRMRISGDLHDHVGAQLSYVVSNLDIAGKELENGVTPFKRLRDVTEMSKQAIGTLRETVWALNNEAISVEEFSDKFKSFARKMSEYSEGIKLEFRDDIVMNHILSPGVALHLFRICQEAFGNALKHASATTISIKIKCLKDCFFEFELTDNGVGFDEEYSRKKGHYGLQNMRGRASEIGAQFQLISHIGKGTMIKMNLQYPQS